MKNILRTLLFITVIAMFSSLQAQVVMKEDLTRNITGKIDKSVNNDGKPLYYKLEYKSTEGARINYQLTFYKDAGMAKPVVSFPVLIRNLIWTYYLDVSMDKDGMTKVFAMIYQKDLRWARVKYSPHTGCANKEPITWERMNLVDNYEKLLNGTFAQLDKNVNLDCYVK